MTKILSEQEQLALAFKIASEVHYGQYDKAGKPYILHPVHLAMQLLYDTQLATIALLNDVIEDSQDIGAYELRLKGFSKRVTDAVALLTHIKGETYASYIEHICSNYDAIRVKRKDLEHNSQITRLKGVTQKDLGRMEKYHRAFVRLGKAKRKFQNV